MTILALDLSTTATGYAQFIDGQLIRCGTFRPNPRKDWTDRALDVAAEIMKYDFDVVVCEDVPLQRNGLPTLMKLCVLQGMIRQQVHDCNRDIYLFNPTKWRSLVGIKTFHKKRDELKIAAVNKANELYGLQLEKKDNDAAEAALIGQAYLSLT